MKCNFDWNHGTNKINEYVVWSDKEDGVLITNAHEWQLNIAARAVLGGLDGFMHILKEIGCECEYHKEENPDTNNRKIIQL